VTDLLAAGRDVTERTYNGYTVYASGNGSQLAPLDEAGEYVVGTQWAVEATLDVRAGDASPVSGNLRTAFAAAREGYVRFAVNVSADRLPSGSPAAARNVEYGYGSLSRRDGSSDGGGDPSSVMLSVSARASDADSAAALREQLQAGLTAVRDSLDELDRPGLRNRAERLVERTEVSRDGVTVTVRNPDGGVAVATAVAALVAIFVIGVGQQQPAAPTALFEFYYADTGDRLTITHGGGDSIDASQLTVRGEGLAATGTWRALDGEASAGGDPVAVTAGDRVAVGADGDYRVEVVWESADGTATEVLATDDGPAA
jgi:ElaB/YqjD/DUF883 family membrane-anchored ribosome-binding protein